MHACVCVSVTCTTTTEKKRWTGVVVPPSLSLQPPHMRVLLARWPTWYKSFYTHHVPPDKHFSLSLFSFSFLFRYFFIFYLRLTLPVFPYSHDFVCILKCTQSKRGNFFFLFWNDEICKSRRLKGLTLFEVCCVIYTRDVCPHLEGFKKLGGCLFFFFFKIIIFY